jgi:hypothetical protein
MHALVLQANRNHSVLASTILCTFRKQGYWTRKRAEQFIQPLSELLQDKTIPLKQRKDLKQWLSVLQNQQLSWVLVKSADPIGRQTCYDITVPGALTFATSDGVFVQDTMSFSVPVSKEAVQEAWERLTPSANLLSAKNNQPQFLPSQEYAQGGWLMRKEPQQEAPRKFKSWEEADAAERRGEIEIDTPVIIGS